MLGTEIEDRRQGDRYNKQVYKIFLWEPSGTLVLFSHTHTHTCIYDSDIWGLLRLGAIDNGRNDLINGPIWSVVQKGEMSSCYALKDLPW